ncbi:MAG TPA: ATP-binding cassette domain-containing protein, partial [Candidatus Binataceae bacterium]
MTLPLIDLRRVTVMRGMKPVLREVDLRIDVGEHVAILGPNGSGKSTLIKTITRELYPLIREESRLKILGQDRWNVFDLRSMLGIVSNDLASHFATEISGRNVVLSGFFSSVGLANNHQITKAMRTKTDELMDLLDLSHLADRSMSEMSSGEMHRTLVARALVHDPPSLLLDEPSSSLDLFAQQELRGTLRRLARLGTGILMITHHLGDIIPEIERVIFLRQGMISADGPKQDLL